MRPTVLVVDDDADLRDLVSLLLEDAGFDVELAGNGSEALERTAQHLPDVILLDIMMPVMDGPTFMARFHADNDRAVPVVVMTAAEHAASLARALGADAWLAKPFTADDLIASVNRQLAP